MDDDDNLDPVDPASFLISLGLLMMVQTCYEAGIPKGELLKHVEIYYDRLSKETSRRAN